MINMEELKNKIEKNEKPVYTRVLVSSNMPVLYCYGCYSELIGEVYARVRYQPLPEHENSPWGVDHLLCLRCGKTEKKEKLLIDHIVPEVQECLKNMVKAGRL